jgi:hypothetical protein
MRLEETQRNMRHHLPQMVVAAAAAASLTWFLCLTSPGERLLLLKANKISGCKRKESRQKH